MNEKEISKYSIKELLDIINSLEVGNQIKADFIDDTCINDMVNNLKKRKKQIDIYEDRIEKLETLNKKLSDNLKKSTDTMLKQAKEIESLNMQKEFCIQEATKKLNTPLEVKCDDTLIFNCQVNGKTLDKTDLYYICDYVRASDIAETLQDNYDIEKTVSLKMGYKAVDFMDDYNITKTEAIEDVLAQNKHEQLSDITVKLTELYNEMFDLCSQQELENELMCIDDMVKNLKKRKGE